MEFILNFFRKKQKETIPGKLEIKEIFQITGIGTILVILIKSGRLSIGAQLEARGKKGRVKSMEKNHKSIQSATAGQSIGIVTVGLDKEDLRKGDILDFR